MAWAAGCAGEPGPAGEVTASLVGGTTDPHGVASGHSAVRVHFPGGECTGTLVAPDWVILAAHCYEGGTPFVIFLVGARIRAIDLGSGARRALDLGAVSLGRILAATYEYARDTLYVIDEVPAGRRGRHRSARLLSVDPDTGAASVVAAWHRGGLSSRFALAAAPSGLLYLVASGDRGPHFVVEIEPESGALGSVGRGSWPLRLEDAHASRAEVSFVVERRRSVGVESVALSGERWRERDPARHCF